MTNLFLAHNNLVSEKTNEIIWCSHDSY